MNIPPPDAAAHQDRVLMAEVGKLNERLSRYILRYLAADARQADPISVTEERALAETMSALAGKVQERASRRTVWDTSPVLEGDASVRRLTNGRPFER